MKTAIYSLIAIAAIFTASTASANATGGARPYPKKTCVVSGNELGSMGKIITKVYEGQEVKFCCKPCVKKFTNNPSRYLSDL